MSTLVISSALATKYFEESKEALTSAVDEYCPEEARQAFITIAGFPAQLAEARREALQEALGKAGIGVKAAHTDEAQTHCNAVYDAIAALLDAEAPAQPKPDAVRKPAMTVGYDLSSGPDESVIWIRNPTPGMVEAIRALAEGDSDV